MRRQHALYLRRKLRPPVVLHVSMPDQLTRNRLLRPDVEAERQTVHEERLVTVRGLPKPVAATNQLVKVGLTGLAPRLHKIVDTERAHGGQNCLVQEFGRALCCLFLQHPLISRLQFNISCSCTAISWLKAQVMATRMTLTHCLLIYHLGRIKPTLALTLTPSCIRSRLLRLA